MIELILIYQIFLVLIIAIGLWLGFWVLLAGRKTKLNQLFFLITILIVLWAIFAHLGFTANESEKSVICYRLNWGVVSLFFIATYFLSIYFPKKITENRFLTKIVAFLGSIFFFFSVFTDLIIKDVIIKEWGAEIIFGYLGDFGFKGFSLLLTIIILYNLFKKYSILSTKERLKTQYFLIGILILAVANIVFNIVFPLTLETVKYQHFGDFSAIFFLGFTAYAIVKRQLFGIKVVLISFLVGLIAILLAVDLFVFTPQLSVQIFKGLTLIIFLFFGHMLIKNVFAEIKRREDLEQKTRKLKFALGKLKKLDNAKSSFVALTSHQLRTPLTAIKGYISMIIEGDYGRVSKETVEPLQAVYSSNERLIRLVNDLLDLSKIDAGKMELNKEKAYLEGIIISIIDELKFSAEEKGLFLRFEKPNKKLAKVLIDKSRIRQVFLNIIDNAIKYTDEGGVSIRIKKIGDIQQVEIRDTGMGIEKDYLPHLFDSFQRGKSSRKVAGSGLGLHIAKKFIKMHNGEIWAESPIQNTKKGSIFYITFPIKQE